MKFTEKFKTKKRSIMVLGTSSGVGKSIIVTALCRIFKDLGEEPIPFKAQNMSNNAWVDFNGGEMAYSQAIQAFAAKLIPSSKMNPILLKPQGDATSEVIHLGKSVGISTARNYYENWFEPGWNLTKQAIKKIIDENPNYRLIIEGAGSPVEMNLKHRDITNLKVAKYLEADCILVADIERGGVFAQIIGTLELMTPEEKRLIKGIIINRFRGDISLFNEGKKWLENKTKIPILGILPFLNDELPKEDSLDLNHLEKYKKESDLKVGIIKFPSISNFSDFDPLEQEDTIELKWIKRSQRLDKFDLIILPGSKQTIKDLEFINSTGISRNIEEYANLKGNIFGICGGLQMLGEKLEDPFSNQGIVNHKIKSIKGIGLLPLSTKFKKRKKTRQVTCNALWPCQTIINGFEIHNGISEIICEKSHKILSIAKEENIGWYYKKVKRGTIVGTYLHGIFENDIWMTSYINLIRKEKGLPKLDKIKKNYKIKRESIIIKLALHFSKYVNISILIN